MFLGQEGVSPNPLRKAGDLTNTGVTNYSTGHHRNTERYVLEMRWGPTDAALAYYLTKNSENDTQKSRNVRARTGSKADRLS